MLKINPTKPQSRYKMVFLIIEGISFSFRLDKTEKALCLKVIIIERYKHNLGF